MSNNQGKNFPISNSPYISCIRIHGLRILPPLLSDEKRHRMQYYKQLALKVEEKIKNKHLLSRLSDSTDDTQSATFIDTNSSTISDSLSSSSEEEPTFKSQIFSESCRSDILKMLNDIPNTEILNVPLRDNSENKCLNKSMKLPESDKHILVEKMNAENDKSSQLYETHVGNGDKDNSESPHQLIRSNSYTLESPSPFLLALIKQNNNYPPDIKQSETNLKKRRTWDLQKAKEKWSSIENDLNNFKRIENFNSLPSSARTSPVKKMFDFRLHFPEKESDIPTKPRPEMGIKPSTAPVISSERNLPNLVSPIRSQKPEKDTNTPKKTEVLFKSKKEIILPKKPNILSSEKSEMQIRAIIDKIHSEQSIQMSELIARQKKEQENLMKIFAEQQALLLSKIENINQTIDEKNKTIETPIENNETLWKTIEPNFENDKTSLKTIENNKTQSSTPEISEIIAQQNITQTEIRIYTVSEPDILKNSENLLSECKKLLDVPNINSESSSVTTFYSPDDTLNDCTLKSCTPSPEINTRELLVDTTHGSSRFSNNFSFDSLEPTSNGSLGKNIIVKRASICSRQLFPTKEQMWAASKINAGARGYLVRRLIKTERVQNLIKTIRDTLLCAMQLHHETADKIQPADVELHRRLIQQVTAACYSFHDTFFELSIQDQLYIISLDRERQKEKLLRPMSSRSNASLSSTTQKVLERKLKRRSSDSAGGTPSRSSSSRSCYSAGEFRDRAKSIGLSDSAQSSKKTSPQNGVMQRSMSYVANKKPWR